jgi:hypothetical protein
VENFMKPPPIVQPGFRSLAQKTLSLKFSTGP